MQRSTKAQMQLGEIIIVMVIFFFILALGLVFYTQFAVGEAAKEQQYVTDLNLAETGKIVASLPELHCSVVGDEALYCIDYFKAVAFQQALTKEEFRYHYSNTFAGYAVELHCIYPECAPRGINSLTLVNYTQIEGQNNKRPFFMPVLIFNPTTNQHAYGELVIWQYS